MKTKQVIKKKKWAPHMRRPQAGIHNPEYKPHIPDDSYEMYVDRCQKAGVRPVPEGYWERVIRDGKLSIG